MPKQTVFYVGSEQEVAHHASPLQSRIEIALATPDEVLERATRGDLAIFFSEHFDRFRSAITELKTRKCATLYAIDGILEWRNAWENRSDEPACPWTMRPVLCDKVACIGKSQVRVLDGWGNINKTELVGLPRLDHIKHSSRGGELFEEEPAKTKQKEPGKILIMTAKFPGFTDEQIENARRALTDLKDWFSRNPEIDGRAIEPIWRLTRGLDEELGVDNRVSDFTGKELGEVLQQVDAVITTPSTAMLEAMLTGVPVAILEYNQCPHLVPAAWQITGKDQIDVVIRELIDPHHRRMLWQETLLHDHLACNIQSGNKESATDRFCQLVEQMLSTTATQ